MNSGISITQNYLAVCPQALSARSRDKARFRTARWPVSRERLTRPWAPKPAAIGLICPLLIGFSSLRQTLSAALGSVPIYGRIHYPLCLHR